MLGGGAAEVDEEVVDDVVVGAPAAAEDELELCVAAEEPQPESATARSGARTRACLRCMFLIMARSAREQLRFGGQLGTCAPGRRAPWIPAARRGGAIIAASST
jgi:hypothetical protein